MKNQLMSVLAVATMLLAGCSQHQKSDVPTLQGTWSGKQIFRVKRNPEHVCSLIISGKNYEFQDDTDPNAWNKGSFTLREDTTPRQFEAVIGECRVPRLVGKSIIAIYRLEGDTLAMTWNPPGKTEAPSAFDAQGAARVELKRQ